MRRGRTLDRVFTAGITLLGFLVLPILALVVCWLVFQWRGFWQVAAQPLATLGAAAGVLAGALVAYHAALENRSLEKQKLLADRKQGLHERFSDIATHLSDSQTFDRISRVHALAALCDDWGALRDIDSITAVEAATQQQVCVDLLKEMVRFPQPDEDQLVDVTERRHLSAEQRDDLVVRQNIVEIIGSRITGEGPDWRHLDCRLRFSKLRWAQFADKTLAGLDISNSLLDGTEFAGSNLKRTVFTGSSLRFADLSRATLEECELRSTWLRGAQFVGANLSGAHLDNSQLFSTSFNRAKLTNASLTYATTELLNPGPGILNESTIVSKGGRPVHYQFPSSPEPGDVVASFNQTHFHGADLRGARLVHADLSGAHFCHANLQGADLSESHLLGAVVIRAVLGNENSGISLPRGWGFSDSPTLLPLSEHRLRGALFNETDLRTYTPEELTSRGAVLSDPLRLFGIYRDCYSFDPTRYSPA
jgi:uncharacterized protein YjbI with pentapeptide repeats